MSSDAFQLQDEIALISGGGTTLRNLIQRQSVGELPVDFKLVVSSRANAKGIDFAKRKEIPVEIVSRKSFDGAREHSDAIFHSCRQHILPHNRSYMNQCRQHTFHC